MPPSVCDWDALTVIAEPLISVTLNGVAVGGFVPTASVSPDGLVANDSVTVLGCSVTLFVACVPSESVAVSDSTSDEGYSWSGAVKDPLATPSNVWTRWVWQAEGQWWMTSDQLRPLAGIARPPESLA